MVVTFMGSVIDKTFFKMLPKKMGFRDRNSLYIRFSSRLLRARCLALRRATHVNDDL